ncbi:MAG: lipid core-O-antigen ligase-like enyme [Rhodocyclales bacterium]|nr:lipid core-O-antigen ligase-like enyme [Rhodocyclales bacterium]
MLPVLIISTFVLSILSPMHRLPLPSFMHEWLMGAGTIMALIAALRHLQHAHARIDGVVIMQGLLFLIAMFQLSMGLATTPAVLMFCGYLFFVVISYQAGCAIATSEQRVDHVRWLSSAALLAALYSCVCAAFQLSHWPLPFDLVYPPANSGVYGNLAQTNQFNQLLWLGVASSLFLGERGSLRRSLVLTSQLVLVIFSVLSASRTSVIFASVLSVLPFFLSRMQLVRTTGKRRWAALLLPAYLCISVTFSHFEVAEHFGFRSVADRLAHSGLAGNSSSASLQDARLGLWRNVVPSLSPLGVGIGNFRESMRERPELWKSTSFQTVPEHAHNELLNLGSELGWVAMLVFAGGVLWWLLARRKVLLDDVGIWAVSVVGLLGLYAMMEYPLRYLYFLIPFCVALGILGPSVRPMAVLTIPVKMAMLVLVASLSVLVLAYRHFEPVDEIFFRLQFGIGYTGKGNAEIVESLDGVPGWSPFKPYASLVKSMIATPEDVRHGMLRGDCANVVRVWLSPKSLANCAASYYLNGSPEQAQKLLASVCTMIASKSANEVMLHFDWVVGKAGGGIRPAACLGVESPR